MSRVSRYPCVPLGISVGFPVLEIVGLDPKSGLKMGLSGLCFAANEPVRRGWRQRSFPPANVLVNLLVEEPIKGLPTLLTCRLSGLVGGLERGLFHRSVAHYWSTYFRAMSPLNLIPGRSFNAENVRGRACWKRGFLRARDLSRPPGGPRKFTVIVFRYRFQYRFQCPFLYLFSELDSRPWFHGRVRQPVSKAFSSLVFSVRFRGWRG